MKHIFTIHSHITYLAALGAINYENLDSKNVILICNSGYKPLLPSSYQGKTVIGLDDTPEEKSLINKIKLFSYSNNAKSYINKLSEGEDYIAYIDLMSTFNKYLVFQDNCVAFNIIEEGLVNYGDFYDLNLLTTDLKNFSWKWIGISHFNEFLKGVFRLYRGRSIRMQSLPIHPNIYANFPNVKSYCFSETAFPRISSTNRKVLDFKKIKELGVSDKKYLDGAWFWIGDVASFQYKINMDHFKCAIQKLMEKINPEKENRNIYLKFRGPESEDEKRITSEVLEYYGFNITYLDENSILELVFVKGIDFKVCGIASSLLVYASNFGHKTFSILPYIPDIYGISIYQSYPVIAKRVYNGE